MTGTFFHQKMIGNSKCIESLHKEQECSNWNGDNRDGEIKALLKSYIGVRSLLPLHQSIK